MTDMPDKMRITDTHVYFVSGPFSQWQPSPFSARLPILDRSSPRPVVVPSDEIYRFSHAEQAMMAAKASVFEDSSTLAQILTSTSPKEQKALGRQVGNFVSSVWGEVAYRIVCIMNFEKFSADPLLAAILTETGSRHLVEGAWYDSIWGVGLGWDDPAIEDAANWKGSNWLGEALMAVRPELDGQQKNPWQIEGFHHIRASANR